MADNKLAKAEPVSPAPKQQSGGSPQSGGTGENGLAKMFAWLGKATGLYKPAALANQALRGEAFARSAVGDMASASSEFTQEFQKDVELAKVELNADKVELKGQVKQLTSERDAARAEAASARSVAKS